MLPVSWAGTMLTTGSSSFLRNTVALCRSKGCKISSCQVGGLKKILPHSQSWTIRLRPGFESWMIGSHPKLNILKLCSPLTYRDSQCLFRKILTPLLTYFLMKRQTLFLKIDFFLSIWPHFHTVYAIGVCIFLPRMCQHCKIWGTFL